MNAVQQTAMHAAMNARLPATMRCTSRLFTATLAGLALVGLHGHAPASAEAKTNPTTPPSAAAAVFFCEFSDGRQGFSAQDLSRDFPETVRTCTARAVVALAPRPRRSDDLELLTLSPDLPGRLRRRAPGLRPLPADVDALVRASGRRHGVDPHLVAALVHVESRGQAQARSPKGALGLMQVMPATGQRYGVGSASELLDPVVNVDAGVRYLKDLLHLFDGQTHLALAAYNAGEGAVMRYGRRIPPYPETQSYVRQVLARYQSLGEP